MKNVWRWLPVVAAIGIDFWLGTLDAKKHRAHQASEAAASR